MSNNDDNIIHLPVATTARVIDAPEKGQLDEFDDIKLELNQLLKLTCSTLREMSKPLGIGEFLSRQVENPTISLPPPPRKVSVEKAIHVYEKCYRTLSASNLETGLTSGLCKDLRQDFSIIRLFELPAYGCPINSLIKATMDNANRITHLLNRLQKLLPCINKINSELSKTLKLMNQNATELDRFMAELASLPERLDRQTKDIHEHLLKKVELVSTNKLMFSTWVANIDTGHENAAFAAENLTQTAIFPDARVIALTNTLKQSIFDLQVCDPNFKFSEQSWKLPEYFSLPPIDEKFSLLSQSLWKTYLLYENQLKKAEYDIKMAAELQKKILGHLEEGQSLFPQIHSLAKARLASIRHGSSFSQKDFESLYTLQKSLKDVELSYNRGVFKFKKSFRLLIKRSHNDISIDLCLPSQLNECLIQLAAQRLLFEKSNKYLENLQSNLDTAANEIATILGNLQRRSPKMMRSIAKIILFAESM